MSEVRKCFSKKYHKWTERKKFLLQKELNAGLNEQEKVELEKIDEKLNSYNSGHNVRKRRDKFREPSFSYNH